MVRNAKLVGQSIIYLPTEERLLWSSVTLCCVTDIYIYLYELLQVLHMVRNAKLVGQSIIYLYTEERLP